MTDVKRIEAGPFKLDYISRVEERMDVIQPGSFPAQMKWHEAQCHLEYCPEGSDKIEMRIFILRTPEIIFHKFSPDFAESLLDGEKPDEVLLHLWELVCELPRLPIPVIVTGENARVL